MSAMRVLVDTARLILTSLASVPSFVGHTIWSLTVPLVCYALALTVYSVCVGEAVYQLTEALL